MYYRILYLVYIIICVLYPFKLVAGPVTYRHILSLLMIGVCVFKGFKSEKYLHLYFVFLLCFGLSSLLTGYIGEFANKLLGTYIPLVAVYIATYMLIRKYKGSKILVWTFVGITMLDAVITIGQFLHLGFVDTVFSTLQFDEDEEFLDKSERRYGEIGFTIPGLFGTVNNGYFLSATALLVLYNKNSNILINIPLWLIVMVASLFAQERTGFFLAVIFSIFLIGKFFYEKSKKIGIVVAVIFVAVAAYLSLFYLDVLFSSDLRFSKEFELGGRDELRAGAWEYISSNIFGGAYEFDATGHRPPHNFFVNAFLYGGIIGGACIIALLIIQVLRIYPYLFRRLVTENSRWAFIFGLMYIVYSLNSMLHNASMIHGTYLFFVWWGAFLGFASLDEIETKKKKRLTK